MSPILKLVLTMIALLSLSACTIVPPHAEYTGPRVEIVTGRPAPYYAVPAPSYYYYPSERHHHGHRHRDRRW